MFRVVTAHNTSLGDNDAFPPREDVAFDYHVLKKRFDEVIGNMESEFGYLPSPDEALSLLSEYVTLAQRKEEPIKNQLETLAFNIVNEALCVPKETVILRTSLVNRVEPLNDIRVMPEDDETSNDGYSFEDIDEVILTNKAVMKRRLINSLVQGVSYRLMLQYLDDDQIYEWDNDLVDIYYKIIYLNDYLLFTKKEKISDKHPMLGSYVDTDLGEGEKKTEIYAQALVYPLLLQEVFRGFFELFGSYGLPDDKKKANMILHKADFLVAEAWDLRMGVGLWDIVSECTTIGEDSYLPYVFTSIVALQGVEFNKMMQNIFCHTKTAQSFILGVIEDVKHDQDYNVFKQDIQTANLKKCLINDEDSKEEERTINESGMRSWKYWNEIRNIANRIIKDKAKILKAENFKTYDLIIDGKDYPVYVANRQVFLSYNPGYTSVAGFFNGVCIELWIDRDTQLKQVLSILSHEIEHIIDSESSPEFENYKQTDLQGKAYSYVEIPDFVKNGDENALYLFKTIREILYHLWIKTETNAFIANAMKDGPIFFDWIENDIKVVNETNANDYPEIWDYFSNVLARKNKICYDIDEITPQLIKKHFVSQSYHKLKKLKETYQKKKGYAKMHGIDINSEFDDNVCYLFFPDEGKLDEYGPYSFDNVIEAYKNGELPERTFCRKDGEHGSYSLYDWINGIDNEDREFNGDPPTSGKLKLAMSTNKADAYHKTKLFYLSTQRSKNNRLGYARNREVRIELDGYKLKSHGYQGQPLDYWGGFMGKQSEIGIDAFKKKYGNKNDNYSDEQRRNITNSQAHTTNFEFEDRIFSNKPSLSLDYVSRIDCLVEELEPIDKDILNMAQKLGVNIAFYNSEKDFILQTNNVINDEVSRIEGEYDNRWDKYDDSQKSRTYPELITKLCALLFYYKFYNNHNSNPQVINDAISNVLTKFDLSEYTEHVINELPHVIMWIRRDIPYLETAFRKLNTDSFTNAKKSENIMLLAQYVLNHYKVSSFVGLNIYFEKHPWQKDRPKEVKVKEFVKCVRVNGYDDYRILKADNKRFWDYMDKGFFYNEISRLIDNDEWSKQNGYEDDVLIHHKSKDAQSFLKYIQWLMHNNNLSLYDGATIVGKLFSLEDLKSIFGFDMTPCTLNKAEYIKEEDAWHIPLQEQDDIRLELFGSDQNYYRYRYPESEN